MVRADDSRSCPLPEWWKSLTICSVRDFARAYSQAREHNASLHCWRDGQTELEKHSSSLEPEDLRNGGYEEVVEFVRALQSGVPPRPSVADILPSVRICFAIAESVQNSN